MGKPTYTVPRYRVRLVRDRQVRYKATNPGDAAAILKTICCDDRGDRECMAVVYLDGGCNVIGCELVAMGGSHGLVVTSGEVLRGALLAGARAIIIGHNHPSGDSTPSPEDITMTRAIARAGTVVGVEVADHIVVTEWGHTSMRESLGEKFEELKQQQETGNVWSGKAER